jgi:hypothetical protein
VPLLSTVFFCSVVLSVPAGGAGTGAGATAKGGVTVVDVDVSEEVVCASAALPINKHTALQARR